MRIAVMVARLEMQGGCERQALRLAAELQAMGQEVTVFTNQLSRDNCYPDFVSRLNIVATGRHRLAARLPSRRMADYLDMGVLARSVVGRFDVLNPHHWPPHWAAVRAARRLDSRPAVVWMCTDPPWGFGPGERPEALRAMNPLRRAGRAVFLLHDRCAVRGVGSSVVMSLQARRVFESVYGAPATVVRSGVDLPALRGAAARAAARSVREVHGIARRTFLLLTVNLPTPQRRVEDAVEAVGALVARGRDVHLLALGSTDGGAGYWGRLQRLVRGRGLGGHITLVGGVPESRLTAYYLAADAYMHPNEEQTWGLAVMEAMACGKPAIVSTGAGVSEVLTDGTDALLVPPRRPDLLAANIRRLMDDPELARGIAAAGRELVARRFSWRRYAEDMRRVFEEARAQHRAARAESPAVGPATSLRETGREAP